MLECAGPRLRVSQDVRNRASGIYSKCSARVGQQPCQDVVSDIIEHGALVVDLELCGANIEAVSLCLREAPAGIHQIVLYSGGHYFGADAQYRAMLRAVRKRSRSRPISDEMLRNLMLAVQSFCSVRGSQLAVLDLAGLGLIHRVPTLIRPLAQMLGDLKTLQRLDLSGCGLQDRGLAALLPQLACGLPKLSRLSLARNGLRDARLVAHLLQSRARLQLKRHAVALRVLDLSANPSLGASRQGGRRLGRPLGHPSGTSSQRTRSGAGRAPSRRRREPVETTHIPLLRILCESLRQGLQLRSLRLHCMGLSREDMRPLLELLRHEIAHRQHGIQKRDAEFPLAEVHLEGNPLVELEYQAAITHGLRQLSHMSAPPGRVDVPDMFASTRHEMPGRTMDGTSWFKTHRAPDYARPMFRPPERADSAGTAGAYGSRSGSSKSLPPNLRDGADNDGGQGLERNAVSEGDADSDQETEMFHHQGRYDMKHQFQEELEAIAACSSPPSLSNRQRASPRAGTAATQGSNSYRATSASVTSNETSSRGGNIPVNAMPDRGVARGFVPDRGVECGFGPMPSSQVYQASHLDPSDTDSENGPLLPHSCGGSHQDDELEHAAAKAQEGHASSRTSGRDNELEATRESDPHERLDAVSERLRDGGIQPGNHVLRWALDRINSDVSSSAEQGQEIPPPPSWVRPEVEPDGVFGGPLAQPVDSELLQRQHAQGRNGSEGSGSPWEAHEMDDARMRRHHSA